LLEQKAFHLLSIINASPVSNANTELSNVLVKEYEMSEISRILLEISVQIRNQLDLNKLDYEGFKFNPNTEDGKLNVENKNDPKFIELTFREACNKIIHAQHINFDMLNAKSLKEYEQINSIIYLYGEYKDISWKAQLDIVKYISVLINIK